MHLKELLQIFNASNFAVYCCLLVFSVLLSLRVDEVIRWSYAVIFLPLWVWNTLTLAGMVVGIVFWIRKKRLRQDPEHVHHFKAMVLSAALQFPLFLTELLVVINIEVGGHSWRAIFTPLYFLCALCIMACVWTCFRKRSFELELLGIANLLQIVFLGIRLDGVVSWSWAIVFIPSWILLFAFVIGVGVYTCMLAVLYKIEENQQELEQRKLANILLVLCASIVAVCLIIFLALLVSQLDDKISVPYSAIFVPLHIAILALIVTTISRQPGNPWWFGIRKNFTDFVLDTCPILQEYANISHVKEDQETLVTDLEEERAGSRPKHSYKLEKTVQGPIVDVYLSEDIYTPD